jgi:hypothetical protein
MSLAEIESKVLQLSEEDRRQFGRWFYRHEAEILGPLADEEEESEEVKAELMRRRQEMDEHPEKWETFHVEEFDRMVREFADERAQRTPAPPQLY